MKADYIPFYLEGREAKPLKADIDTQRIAEDVAAGKGSIHELLSDAVSKAAKGLEVDKAKRRWIAEWEQEINEAGGDSEAAHEHYTQGRIDELVHRLEPEVLEDLEDDDGEEGDEEDDEDEDDDPEAAE